MVHGRVTLTSMKHELAHLTWANNEPEREKECWKYETAGANTIDLSLRCCVVLSHLYLRVISCFAIMSSNNKVSSACVNNVRIFHCVFRNHVLYSGHLCFRDTTFLLKRYSTVLLLYRTINIAVHTYNYVTSENF